MKKFLMKFGPAFAAFALMITTYNINATCMCYAHQPKLPKGAQKLRKF
ncbi:MAG: cyclic lactone autoinducer peptide [Solibacillus sp.]